MKVCRDANCDRPGEELPLSEFSKKWSRQLAGQRRGRQLILRAVGRKKGKTLWMIRCDCGNERTIISGEVNRIRYCGLGCPLRPAYHKTHALSRSPTYFSWKAMRQRCNNPKDPSFARYGGAGITVCKRWDVFENFLRDMGIRPAKTTIDRINNDGNYEPGNCRWATYVEQANNKNGRVYFEFGGQRLTLSQWANMCHINYVTLQTRLLRLKWPIEKAITTPIQIQRRRARLRLGGVK